MSKTHFQSHKVTDEGVTTTFYLDFDGDTYGVPTSTTQACIDPLGFSSNSLDCNDDNADIFPGNPEICNHMDDNCNNRSRSLESLSFSFSIYSPNP